MERRVIFACASILAACDGAGEPDAGADAGAPDLPALEAFVENAESDAFETRPLDHTCLDSRTQPVSGSPVPATFQLLDFQDDFPVEETDVWLFSSNEIGDSCTAPGCQEFTTGADGTAPVTLAADGWYAYRVFPKDGLTRMTSVFAVFQYNEAAPAAEGGTVVGNSVSGTTIDLIPALLGITRTDGLAIIAGRLEDCASNFVSGAIVRVFDPDGEEVSAGPGNEDPHFHYFNGNAENNIPDQTQPYSNDDGLYVVVQVEVIDDRPYRVEAWGEVDGTYRRISCEAARIFPDAVTILNLAPERADRPASCD
jgi:hypothetical protein